MMTSLAEPFQARTLGEIAGAYGLTILQNPADWSLDQTGDLALTADGDIRGGTTAYNALFRLAQLWRYNEPHLRYMFGATNEMLRWSAKLSEELDVTSFQNGAAITANPWAGFEQFAEAVRGNVDRRGIAHFGANTYAGCLLIALSNALLRFKRDIAAGDAWMTASPSFNGYSVGPIIVASANGYRHEDEWSKASALDKRQKASHDIITGALAGQPTADETTVARSVEIIQLLSQGDYEVLANNVLGFAHEVALAEEAKS